MIVGIRTSPSLGDLDPNAILWPSRDELGAQTDLLLERIKGLADDWFTSDAPGVSQELLARWRGFVADVNAWDSGPRFLAHIIDATWRDELLAYQKQFNSFRGEFQAAGVSVSTPAFTFVPPAPSTVDKAIDKITDPIKKGADDLASTIKTVAIVGGLAVVGFVFYLTFETGRTARAIGPSLVRRR